MHHRLRARATVLLPLLTFLASCELERHPDGSSHSAAAIEMGSTGRRLPGSVDSTAGVEIRALLINRSTVPDSLGEWIELRNPGTRDVELAGWRLDSGGDPGFVFPPGTVIPSGGRLDLGGSRDPTKTGGVRVKLVLAGISLGDDGDWLALRNGRGETVDSVAWRGSAPEMPLTHRPRRDSGSAEDGDLGH